MDIDAYILDYMNKKILYVTKGSSLFFENTLDDILFRASLFSQLISRKLEIH